MTKSYLFHQITTSEIAKVFEKKYNIYTNGESIKSLDTTDIYYDKLSYYNMSVLLDSVEVYCQTIDELDFLLYVDKYIFFVKRIVYLRNQSVDPRIGPCIKEFAKEIKICFASFSDLQNYKRSKRIRLAKNYDMNNEKRSINKIVEDTKKKIKSIITFNSGSKEKKEVNVDAFLVSTKVAEKATKVISKYIDRAKVVYLTNGINIRINKIRYIVTKIISNNSSDNEITAINSDVGISYDIDDKGEFKEVYISPFFDTISITRSQDLLREFVLPYLQINNVNRYVEGDRFTHLGVEFKILKTVPRSLPTQLHTESCWVSNICELVDKVDVESKMRRVSQTTRIFFGSPIIPSWLDVLPKEYYRLILALPASLQAKAMINMVKKQSAVTFERILDANNLLNNEAYEYPNSLEETKEKLKRGFLLSKNTNSTEMCPICLVENQSDCMVKLSCEHTYHLNCLTPWIYKSENCPMCKSTVCFD